MNAPEVWWSPGNTHGLDSGLIEKYQGQLYMVSASSDTTWELLDELPADAVRLDPDVSRVRCDWCTGITSLDDEGMVVAHLRPDDWASCPGSHGDDFERVAEAAGAVPDTGHPPLPEVVAVVEAAQALAEAPIPVDTYAKRRRLDLIQLIRDRVRALPEGWRDGAAASPSPDTVQAPESPTDSTPKSGRWGSSEAETATGTVQAPDVAARCSCTATHCLVSCVICGRVSYDGDCPNEAVSDREAVLERERLVQQEVLEQYEHKIEAFGAREAAVLKLCDEAEKRAHDMVGIFSGKQGAQVPPWVDRVRGLLGTDTTPDRLAWISEAGETAAAERQARYQETACARRPAEETPDV